MFVYIQSTKYPEPKQGEVWHQQTSEIKISSHTDSQAYVTPLIYNLSIFHANSRFSQQNFPSKMNPNAEHFDISGSLS